MSSGSEASLKATYSDTNMPDSQHIFTHDVQQSSSVTTSAEAKSKYLSELRASTKTLQDEVNTFLTKKMEEDKAATATSIPGKKKAKDEEEEENYGEEKVEED